MDSASRKLSDCCHTVTLNVITRRADEHILDRMFASCLRLRNSLAGNARHRLMRLLQDAEYRSLREELRTLLKSKDPDRERKQAVTSRLNAIRSAYGLGSRPEFEKCIAPIRRNYFNEKDVPSHIAQTIAADVWSGVENILFKNGKMLSRKNKYTFLSIRGKSNTTTLAFDPLSMVLRVGGLRLHVRSKDDAYMREALGRMRASCRSERAGRGALPGCIRYCTLRRFLVNDHGAVRFGYRLIVTCDGPAPRRKALEPSACRDGRIAALDPSMAMMALYDGDANCTFLLLDGRGPKTEERKKEVSRRMDASRRTTNPERYREDGTFDKKSVNGKTGGREMNRSEHYEDMYLKRKLLLQKKRDTRKHRTSAICNAVIRTYGTIKSEGMQNVALSARAKNVRYVKGGKIAPKSRFGSTIQRFAPAGFLAELRRKAEASGGTFEDVNPWTLKASQYDPTDGQCHKHKLSERIFRLSDGTRVQRDLMSAFTILHSVKTEMQDAETKKKKTVDLPDREAMLADLPRFLRSMRETMDRFAEYKPELPPAIGSGAWTTPQDAGKGQPPVDAPTAFKGEIPVLQRACGDGRNGRRCTSGSMESTHKKLEDVSPPRTPLLLLWE